MTIPIQIITNGKPFTCTECGHDTFSPIDIAKDQVTVTYRCNQCGEEYVGTRSSPSSS